MPNLKNDEVVSLTYTDPTAGDDNKAIQDSAGNDAVSHVSTAIKNNSTVPGSAPFITSTYVSSNGTTISLVFNEALSVTLPFLTILLLRTMVYPIKLLQLSSKDQLPSLHLPIMLEKRQLFF